MASAEAYCVELKRAVTLREAHEAYFALPETQRKPFHFMCGDPKCRAITKARVVGAVYRRSDAFDLDAIASGRHRPPYFRSHDRWPHIDDCTWHEPPASGGPANDDPLGQDHGINHSDNGLLWLPDRSKSREPGKVAKSCPSDDAEADTQNEDNEVADDWERPDTTRFLATVGMNYLRMTPEQRRRAPLGIGRAGTLGTYYDICLPIFSFHPEYQARRIYHGQASIAELTNVFIITFDSQFSPRGLKTDRRTVAKIKFVKSQLEADDRRLAEVLSNASSKNEPVHCFFYCVDPPEAKSHGTQQWGWFNIEERAHIFIVPVSLVASTAPIGA
ncbi:MAG: hypothetical protein EPN74_02095 [Rhodanobacter sp.]|nr:MAG: hypothetical protein EPN74_02095 [Rhodanobacter sp.]